jgi:hypothetical protein
MSFSEELFLFLCMLACAFDLYVLVHWLRERDREQPRPPDRRVNPIRKSPESKEAGKQADPGRKGP